MKIDSKQLQIINVLKGAFGLHTSLDLQSNGSGSGADRNLIVSFVEGDVKYSFFLASTEGLTGGVRTTVADVSSGSSELNEAKARHFCIMSKLNVIGERLSQHGLLVA